MKSISNQILISILFTVIIIFGGWGYLEIQNTKKYEAERIEKDQIRIADRLAFNLSYPFWNINTTEINTIIHNEALNENVLSIRAFDELGQLYAGTIRDGEKVYNITKLPYYRIYSLNGAITRQIFRDKKPIGTVVVYLNREPLQLLIRKLSFNLFLKITILIITLAGIQFLLLRRVVIKPISLLKKWALKFESGKVSPPPHLFHSTEIDALKTSFFQMTERLVSSHNELTEKNRQLTESESRIKSISNNFTSGMIYQLIIKPDGDRLFTYLSESVKTLYGITPEEGLADPSLIYSNIHPEDVEHLKMAEDGAMKTLSTFKAEVRMKQVPGIYRWSSFASTPTLLEDGSVRWDGIEFDITEQKNTEEELRQSHQKFAVAFNLTPDVILITDQKTLQFLDVNEAITTVFGYSREEAKGKTSYELNLFKDYKDREKLTKTMAQDGFVHKMEITGRHKSGADLNLLVSIETTDLYNRSYFITTIHDITQRKKIEEELRISQQKFAIAFNSTPDAILITEQETGKIIEANDAVDNVFGYNHEELIGKTGIELNIYKSPSDRQQVVQIFKESGSIRNMEVVRRHKSGSDVMISMSVESSIIDGIPCYITTNHDITEQKRIEEKLRFSQQKFAVAFNSSPDAIFITEFETGRIIEVNDAIMTMYGYTREEALGKTTLELGLFKNPEDRIKIWQTILNNEPVKNLEFKGVNKSGSELTVVLTVEKSEINKQSFLITTVHDLTERKKNEEKLRESEERFKSIIAVSNTGAWEYHLDTDYLWCSPEYFSMLGHNPTDYDISGNSNLQETWIDLLHPEDREMAMNHFSNYLKNGSVGTYESHFRMQCADGSWKWIWSRGQSLRDINGNVTNITVGTHIDITERKLNEMELQKLNLDKDRFMSILGHDLRSPFNGIVGILDLLCTDIKDLNIAEIEELLKMADKSAHNASELLDDVLMWAMAQSGKMTFAPIFLNFKEDCAHVFEILQPVADSKNIKLILESKDDLMVYADRNMLDTVLRNLISNALKFTNEGGKITVSSEKKPDNITISIADTGIGIDPKNIDKIFDKTQLFTSTGTADEKGTGFGLKLCQEFVEKHGGKIWIESELDKGTTFYFTLPNNK